MSDENIAQPRGSDGLATLTTALALYLEEVDNDYRACLRHEGTISVAEYRGGLRLTRFVPRTRAAVAYIQKSAARLPGWRQSPFWVQDGRGWEALARGRPAATTDGLVFRGIAWNGRPMLIDVRPENARELLVIDLVLPHIHGDLPELPIRRAADGSRCHSYLLPDQIAVARPLSTLSLCGADTVLTYLRRATPQGLYASQCFSRPREGR